MRFNLPAFVVTVLLEFIVSCGVFSSDNSSQRQPSAIADDSPKTQSHKAAKKPPLAAPHNIGDADTLSLNSTKVTLLTAKAGRSVLASADEFSSQLTALDRQLRLNKASPVSADDFLQFAASQAHDWAEDERTEIGQLIKEIATASTTLNLRLPDRIYVVRSSLKEEFNANYTRGQSVVLGSEFFDSSKHDHSERFLILAHEIFHIASRYNGSLRQRSHEAVGCLYKTGQVILDAKIRSLIVTNPDAYEFACAFKIKFRNSGDSANDDQVWVMPAPILRWNKIDAPKYSEIKMNLITVTTSDGHWSVQLDSSGDARFIDVASTNFFDLLNINSEYVLHADEVVADNFALLAQRLGGVAASKTKNIKLNYPEFLEKLKAILQSSN